MPSAIHHFGLAVSNLEKSIAFYKAGFGLEVVDRAVFSGEEFSQVVNLPNAVLEYAFLAGDNVVLELLEYREPKGKSFALGNNDVGAAHVCFVVDDLDATYQRLLAMGVKFNTPPKTAPPDPPYNSLKYAYCRDIDGITIELFQPGQGQLSLPNLLRSGRALAQK